LPTDLTTVHRSRCWLPELCKFRLRLPTNLPIGAASTTAHNQLTTMYLGALWGLVGKTPVCQLICMGTVIFGASVAEHDSSAHTCRFREDNDQL
jgi:hypothetical protein